MSDTRQGLFVTGTDTGIGKTVVSAALLARLRSHRPTRYWKPIQTGIEQDDDTATVRALTGCTPREILDAGVRLPLPLSPHASAAAAGVVIDLDDLLVLASAQPSEECWIVEGAGGVLVPINDRALTIELIARLGYPALVVARSGLGTINHTLLTIEALRARMIPVAGVVMVGETNAGNRDAVEHYGRVPVVGELPRLQPLDPSSLAAAIASWQWALIEERAR